MVKHLFAREFRCAGDIAKILADLCCYKQEYLPTGSPLSSYCAFFAMQKMFDELYQTAGKKSEKITMTLYVDDIVFSGMAVTKKWIFCEIHKIICRHGLKVKRQKTRIFHVDAEKIVTGVIVSCDRVRLPNSRHKKIFEKRQAISVTNGEEKEKLIKSLNGCLQEAKQFEKN